MTVLVAYASKRGSTAEIAETVAATLRREGLGVCLEPCEAVRDLDRYDAVVLGSAVYMKRWQGDARHFLKKHRKALRQKPLWVFSSGPVGDPAKDNPDWIEPPKLAEKVEDLGGQGPHGLRRLPPLRTQGDDGEGDGRRRPQGVPRPPRLGTDPRLGKADLSGPRNRPRLEAQRQIFTRAFPVFIDFP